MKYLPSIIFIISVAVLYIFITVYLGNIDLINKTLFGGYSAEYKYKIISSIYFGLSYSHTLIQFIFIILISLLTGLNIFLLAKKITYLRHKGKLHFLLGGSIILGLASGGCAVCGIPLLALVGIGGSIALLPFEGSEFSFLSVLLLVISSIILIRSNKPLSCDVKLKKGLLIKNNQRTNTNQV